MLIDDVKSQTIKDLIVSIVIEPLWASFDFEIALQNSENDQELIDNWQSGLERGRRLLEGYWSRLEEIKNTNPVNIDIERLKALVEENNRLEKEIQELIRKKHNS